MARNQEITGVMDRPDSGMGDFPVFEGSELPAGTRHDGMAYDDRAGLYFDIHVLPDGSTARTVSGFDPSDGIIYLRQEGN